MPNRKELARSLKRLTDHSWPIDGAADHGVSESIYLRDPDQNGIEVYADRPKEKWPRDPDGNLVMYTRPLNLDSLLAELGH
jgi:catechol 2,3-dioxygenase